MTTSRHQRQQAATGLEQLAALVRTQSWRQDGTPSLPPTQSSVLRILDGEPQGMRARELAKRISVSPASLSDSLKALEAKGWIVRDPDPADARAALVRLSAAGARMAAQLLGAGGIAALVKNLGAEDLGAFLRVTQLLVHAAQQQGLATGPRTCLGCRYFRPYASGDAAQPHFCDFVKQPFGDPQLRVDCPEQKPAATTQKAANARRFRQANPP